MEIDELQRAWGQLDLRLAEQGRALASMQRHRGMDRVRTRLRWLSLGLVVELLVGIAIVLWAGSYWVEHRAQAHLLVYGLALHAFGLGLLVFAVIQLLCLANIDYDAAVVTVQRKLHTLERLRMFSGRVMLAAGMVAWVPLFLVVMRGIGMDLWLTQPAVVWANLGVGLAIVAGIEWFMRRHPDRCRREHVGSLLRHAEAELDELSEPTADPEGDGRV